MPAAQQKLSLTGTEGRLSPTADMHPTQKPCEQMQLSASLLPAAEVMVRPTEDGEPR